MSNKFTCELCDVPQCELSMMKIRKNNKEKRGTRIKLNNKGTKNEIEFAFDFTIIELYSFQNERKEQQMKTN